MATKKTAAKPAAAKREPTTRDVNGTTEPRCTVCDRWLAETGSLPRRRRPRQRAHQGADEGGRHEEERAAPHAAHAAPRPRRASARRGGQGSSRRCRLTVGVTT
jgi:hypothetical protein